MYLANNFNFELDGTEIDENCADFDTKLANLDIDWDEEGPVDIIFDAGEFLLCLFLTIS